MIDAFSDTADTLYAPAARSFAIVPDDEAALPIVPKAVYVGTGGTVRLRGMNDSDAISWINVPSGGLIPLRASHVLATGTTATDLIGLA